MPAVVFPECMSISLSERMNVVKPSATVAVSQRAAELRAQGVDVLSFSVGEPDFDTPAHIRTAAKAAMDAGCGKYTSVRGIPELLDAISADSARQRGGLKHERSEIVVSVGAKHTLFNLSMVLFNPGDEVIIPAPYWVSYPAQVRIAEANPVVVQTTADDGYRITPAQLRDSVNEKTKALVLCSPSNPTGSAYSPDHLRALAGEIAKGDYWVVVDEIYAQLVYGGFDQRSLLEVAPELRERIIVVDGVSKTYAMTGWRIGWMLGPKHVAKACEKLQGQSTTNPTAVAQHAALAALTGDRAPIESMRVAFEERRSVMVQGLDSIAGIRCRMPEGAFYAFADVSKLIGTRTPGGSTLENDVALATHLLDSARCATVPGSAFGAPGHLRLSYAAATSTIEEGLRRLRKAVSELS
ncbi:MAG: pyridoxal phosphate-dependent aminotransferase [Myxococcota bacterium]